MLELCQGNGCPRRDALQVAFWEQIKLTGGGGGMLVLEQLPSELRSCRARYWRGMKEITASVTDVNTPDRGRLEEWND